MKTIFSYYALLAACAVSVSCYRIPDRPRDPLPNNQQTTLTSEEQQRIEAQRALMTQREKERKALAEKQQSPIENTTVEGPTETVTSDYPFANPVPGKEGFVFSPYNKKLVDVRDIPSGTLVQDPTYPASEKKYFRVP
jgi:hypothetical protein